MLEVELKYLQSHKDDLGKRYPGQFLVIKGEEVTGAYATHEEALSGAAEKHGLDNVLIRRSEDADMLIFTPALAFGLINANL